MSVNGKNDVIKRPQLPSVVKLPKQISLDKTRPDLIADLFSENHFGGKYLINAFKNN